MLPVSHISFSHMFFNDTLEAGALGVKDRFLVFEFDGVISLTNGFEPCDSRHVEESGSNHTTWNLEGVGGGLPEVDGSQEHRSVTLDWFPGDLDYVENPLLLPGFSFHFLNSVKPFGVNFQISHD